MPPDRMILHRQIWVTPTPTTSALPRHCTPFKLLAGGVLSLDNDTTVTLSQDAVFQPTCSGQPVPNPIDPDQLATDTAVVDAQDPFYASTSPQIYAIAAATIVSYMLVIILFITPRTFIVGGAGTAGGFLGQRNMISRGSGSSPVIGIGSRPWLQKVAALTVAISLTIATADTFSVAQKQYEAGYQDAAALTEEVGQGLEIRITRVISDTCLWLAQVQTLIRLFTRHKEKVIIKWIGFALIFFDTTFSILNYFVIGHGRNRGRRFVDAVPALNYLFALSLSLLYAAWVIYYSLSKHRYAFFHPKMRNIILVAILALAAVLIPVVFFVLDISQPNVSGWGDYVRWVGAAAASVVVWEWVERIEALERDEKKDGILGREVFAGDEMLEFTPSTEVSGSGPRRDHRRGGAQGGQGGGTGNSTGWTSMMSIANRLAGSRVPLSKRHKRGQKNRNRSNTGHKTSMSGAAKPSSAESASAAPLSVASPVNRADTTSAASTVYVIHYHENKDPTPIPCQASNAAGTGAFANQTDVEPRLSLTTNDAENALRQSAFSAGWSRIMNSFRHGGSSPPQEVVQARADAKDALGSTEILPKEPGTVLRPSNFLDRLRPNKTSYIDLASLPRTIIPAPRPGIELLMEQEAARSAQGSELTPEATRFPALGPDSEAYANLRERASVLSAIETPQSASPGFNPIQTRRSPVNIRATQLSRRGSLLISEAYSRPNPLVSPIAPEPSLSLEEEADRETVLATLDPLNENASHSSEALPLPPTGQELSNTAMILPTCDGFREK